jgi:addiction module HigA family antidote
MARKRALQPANRSTGCDAAREFRAADKSQAAFARDRWTKARLNELIKGKRGITADAALDLAEVLGTSPRLWMNLQSTYDLAEATRRRSAA